MGGMVDKHHASQVHPSVAQRILDEGAQPLLDAARDAGLRGDVCPSLKTLLRAALSRKLEAAKVAGRWLTSAAAIRRWVEHSQRRRDGLGAHLDQVGAETLLEAHGLGRRQEGER